MIRETWSSLDDVQSNGDDHLFMKTTVEVQTFEFTARSTLQPADSYQVSHVIRPHLSFALQWIHPAIRIVHRTFWVAAIVKSGWLVYAM